MNYYLITPPSAMAVSLADARNSARKNGTDSDVEIETQVRAITADAEHITGRTTINRTYQVTLEKFDGAIQLPVLPVQSVTVRFFDADGVEQTLDPQDYVVSQSEPVRIKPAYGKTWPATQARDEAVIIDVLCGYGSDDTTMPPAFKGYILAKVQEYFAPPGTPESPYLRGRLDSLKAY